MVIMSTQKKRCDIKMIYIFQFCTHIYGYICTFILQLHTGLGYPNYVKRGGGSKLSVLKRFKNSLLVDHCFLHT